MRVLRVIHLLVAWAVVLAVVVQVFLIGLSLFGTYPRSLHVDLGYTMGVLFLALVASAALARLPGREIALAAAALGLYVVQTVLPWMGIPLAALHPVNALFIFGLTVVVATRARRYLSAPLGTATDEGDPASASSTEGT